MATSPVNNVGLTIINDLIQAIIAGGVVAGEAYIAALDPDLAAIPIVGWLEAQTVQYVADIIQVAGQKFADQIVISIQTGAENNAVINATTALALAQGTGNQAAIAQAAAQAAQAYQKAFALDGWATTS